MHFPTMHAHLHTLDALLCPDIMLSLPTVASRLTLTTIKQSRTITPPTYDPNMRISSAEGIPACQRFSSIKRSALHMLANVLLQPSSHFCPFFVLSLKPHSLNSPQAAQSQRSFWRTENKKAVLQLPLLGKAHLRSLGGLGGLLNHRGRRRCWRRCRGSTRQGRCWLHSGTPLLLLLQAGYLRCRKLDVPQACHLCRLLAG